MHRRGWFCFVAALSLLGTTNAWGQPQLSPQEAEARRRLIEQAQAARVANNHAQALDFANRAGDMQMTASLRLFIAQEQQAVGQLAEALGNAEICGREAQQMPPNDRARAQQIQQACDDIKTALRPQVGQVTVQVPSPAPPGIRVFIGNNEVRQALWGIPYSVTPGRVHVTARVSGYPPFERDVDVAAGATVPVPIELRVDTTHRIDNENPNHNQNQNTTPTTPPPPSSGLSPGPFVLMGVGVASMAVSAALFFGPRNSNLAMCSAVAGDANGALNCPSEDVIGTIRAMNSASIATLAIGSVAIVGGVVWLAVGLATKKPAAQAHTTTTGFLVPTPGGLQFGVHTAF